MDDPNTIFNRFIHSRAGDSDAPADPRRWLREPRIIGTLIAVGAVLAIVALLSMPRGAVRGPEPLKISTPVSMPVSPVPSVLASPVASGDTLPRATTAYGSPGVNPLGEVGAGRPYRAVGRYHTEWLLVDLEGSGRVWLLASDVGPVDTALPNLAPRPTAPPAPAPAPVYVPAPAAAAAPVPTVCAWGAAMGKVCAAGEDPAYLQQLASATDTAGLRKAQTATSGGPRP